MPSESKPLLTAQTEKPNHYKYLKEFRVEQCPSFLQHKCTQHRPFTCFHWHFNNQRRRRPVRKRDGSFNYSADNYCTKYNETSGVCEDGDECPFLHRTAGDTERRYHLRYYKTCMCVHDTDSRGFCVKNGPHCAFAHGNTDLRPPVYDIKEIQALENPDSEINGCLANGPNVLDKERNLMNEDPKWQDTNYVLSSYKTEACKRPPRLCRQGYACPQYHNSKDKRRSPRKHKYRSTPCPNVKHGEEWGEPSNCDAGDACPYCHTRTEQQFHPEIYKSTKCNDVQQAGYCPRGVFCAFAHVEPEEMALARELAGPLECGTNFADILSSALPPDKKSSESSNGSGEASESASTSSVGSSGGCARAPGAPLRAQPAMNTPTLLSQHGTMAQHIAQSAHSMPDFRSEITAQMLAIESDPSLTTLERAARKQALCSAWQHAAAAAAASALPPSHTHPRSHSAHAMQNAFDTALLQEVVGNALEDLNMEEPSNMLATLDRDLSEGESMALNNCSLMGSAPVNIPGRSLRGFTPPSGGGGAGAGSPMYVRYPEPPEAMYNSQPPASMKGGSYGTGGGGGDGMFQFQSPSLSPGVSEFVRMQAQAQSRNDQHQRWDEATRLNQQVNQQQNSTITVKTAEWDQARTICEVWQRESEEAQRKTSYAELQRDEAIAHAAALRRELEATVVSPAARAIRSARTADLRGLPLPTLKALQAQLRAELEEIDKVLYLETATKCMVCEENNRSVTLAPCNHYVLCDTCATTQKECPYCQTPVGDTLQ